MPTSVPTSVHTSVHTLSYGELHHQVLQYARGFSKLGLEAGDRVALFCNNRPEWIGLSLGISCAAGVDVPRGENSTEEEIDYIIEHSSPRFVVVENQWFLEAVRKSSVFSSSRSGTVPLVCVPPVFSIEPMDGVPNVCDIREAGRSDVSLPPVAPATMASLVYTSGTTARPKGVVLTHGNFAGNLRALIKRIPFSPTDRLLSILPAWHTFERMVKYLALAMGSETFYSTWRTFKADLKTHRPTVMASVPRIWEMMHHAVVKQARQLGVEIGPRAYAALKADLGGRFRFAISGGGALPAHVENFFTAAGVEIVEGYGLTETSPVVAVRVPGTPAPHTVGPLLENVEGRIIHPETKEELPEGAEGVLAVRGPNIMQGYYRLDDESRAVLTKDGWFDTGDLACFNPGGNLVITGRAKEVIVLSNGENVNPLPLEEALKESDCIIDAIVVGQDWKALGVLIVPDPEMFRELCLEARLQYDADDLVPLFSDPVVRRLFKAEIDRLVNGKSGIKPFEKLQRFRLLPGPFQPGRELTSTKKPRRHVIEKIYAGQMDGLRREIQSEPDDVGVRMKYTG